MGSPVTRASRRNAMIALLVLAVAGAIVRALAPDPSTLRDIGTLLLVLWLPVVGNLIAWLIGKFPRKPAAVPGFPAGTAFVPHLDAQAQANPLSDRERAALDLDDVHCLLVVGRQGFRARLSMPMAAVLAQESPFAVELLRPEAGLPELPQGTEFHMLSGDVAVARGRVLGHRRSGTVAN